MKQKEPERELTPEEERVLIGFTVSAGAALTFILVILIVILCQGCKTIEYVPVPEVHTEYHHTTDSVFHTDSIIDRQTTIIQQVDSATMAQYGIKLEQAQKAWLIQSDRFYKEIERLKSAKTDTVLKTDSIPYPEPGPTEYIPAEFTAWQKFRMNLGGIAFWLLLIGAGIGLYKTRAKWLPWLLKLLRKL